MMLWNPPAADRSIRIGVLLDLTPEPNFHHVSGLWKLPRVAIQQPFVGLFYLPAVAKLLLEDSELVSDSITDGGNVQRCQGVEKAGCQPAKAPVAQPWFDIERNEFIEIQVVRRQGLTGKLSRVRVEHVLR